MVKSVDCGSFVSSAKMTVENVCRFNNFGYCKFGNSCFRYHGNDICENGGCPVIGCLFRHPRKCRFFLEFGRCKFGTYCRFAHAPSENKKTLEEIEVLRKEIKEMKLKMKNTEKEIKQKDEEISTLVNEARSKDAHIKNLEQLLEASSERESKKGREIKELERKVNEMVKERDHFYTTIGERDMLLMDFKERMMNKYGFDSKDDDSEYESDENMSEKLNKTKKCGVCQFVGKTESGLKTHITKKHR